MMQNLGILTASALPHAKRSDPTKREAREA